MICPRCDLFTRHSASVSSFSLAFKMTLAEDIYVIKPTHCTLLPQRKMKSVVTLTNTLVNNKVRARFFKKHLLTRPIFVLFTDNGVDATVQPCP